MKQVNFCVVDVDSRMGRMLIRRQEWPQLIGYRKDAKTWTRVSLVGPRTDAQIEAFFRKLITPRSGNHRRRP